MVHLPVMAPCCAGTPPPVSVIKLDDGVAVRVPPQVVLAYGSPGGTDTGATITPPGRVSLTLKPVSGELFVLVSVIVSVDNPFWLMMGG